MPQGRHDIRDHHPQGGDRARLEALFERLRALLDTGPVDTGGLVDHLQRVATTAAAVLHVDGAALMLCATEHRPPAIAASGQAARTLLLTQQRLGRGPCLDATRRGELVSVRDLAGDARWPGLWDEVAGTALHGALSAPIPLDERPAGNLNVFSWTPHDWSPAERRALMAYAAAGGAYLRVAFAGADQARRVDDLRRQLAERHAEGEAPAAGRPRQASPTAAGRPAGPGEHPRQQKA